MHQRNKMLLARASQTVHSNYNLYGMWSPYINNSMIKGKTIKSFKFFK